MSNRKLVKIHKVLAFYWHSLCNWLHCNTQIIIYYFYFSALVISLNENQGGIIEAGKTKTRIEFYTSPPEFIVIDLMNNLPKNTYQIPNDITIDSKFLLQFSMVCMNDRKDFYFMETLIFSLQNTNPIYSIWTKPSSGFELKKFQVSESKYS